MAGQTIKNEIDLADYRARLAISTPGIHSRLVVHLPSRTDFGGFEAQVYSTRRKLISPEATGQ